MLDHYDYSHVHFLRVGIADVRTSYMDHVWDFYKPDLSSEYPTVDGHHSVLCYYKAIDYCYAGVRKQLKKKVCHHVDLHVRFIDGILISSSDARFHRM